MMKKFFSNKRCMLMGAFLSVMLSRPAAAAETIGAQVLTGLRSADFAASPEKREMWLQEISLGVSYTPMANIPASVGLTSIFPQMRGDLGRGLKKFSGYQVGPQVEGWYEVASVGDKQLSLFASLSYLWGRYTGTGSRTWYNDDSLSLFRYGEEATETVDKKYTSRGAHMTAGIKYAILQASQQRGNLVPVGFSAMAALDVGFEELHSDNDELYQGAVLRGRQKTNFASRSVLAGVQLTR